MEKVSIDKYEEMKPQRRTMDQLELNYFVRKRMLRRYCGVSDEEMQAAMNDAHRIHKQRMRTKRMRHILRIEESVLSIASKVSDILSIRRNKNKATNA